MIGPRYRGQVLGLAIGIGGFHRGQVLWAANQGPNSFKAADYVPPEISHDIPLLKRLFCKVDNNDHKIQIFTSTNNFLVHLAKTTPIQYLVLMLTCLGVF